MRRLLAGLLVTFCVFFLVGHTWASRVRISSREDTSKRFYVVITLPPITPEFHWVRVFICAAEITESGVRCVDEGWATSSLKPTREDQRQYEFPFGRYVPRGTLQMSAVVLDADLNVLVGGQAVVMR